MNVLKSGGKTLPQESSPETTILLLSHQRYSNEVCYYYIETKLQSSVI